MDVWSLSLKDRKRSVNFTSVLGVHAQCGGCREAKQIDVVWTSGA